MRAPAWVVPLLVVAFAALGAAGARFLAVPSAVRDFGPPAARERTTVLVVRGLKCADTAEGAADQLKETAGVVRFVGYASRNLAEVTFDPAVTDAAMIKEALEAPVYDEASGEFRFGVYAVVEVDGVKVRQ